jgi:hypothetical protein
MSWTKITSDRRPLSGRERRSSPCVARSPKRPDMAYMMLPREMVPEDRVSIYSDARGRIALLFCPDGEYAVRPTSRTSYTMKVTIPKAIAHLIPMGLHDVQLESGTGGYLILDPQTLA